MEVLERAVQEIEALEAIFGYEEGGFTVHSAPELAAARAVVEAGAAPDGEEWVAPRLEIELRVGIALDDDDASAAPLSARLRCSLPAGYPETSCASVSVAIDGVRRATQDELTASLTEKAGALLGDEAVMELVQELQDTAPGVLAAERAAAAAAAVPRECKEPAAAAAGGFGRRWMWAHHISSAARRGLIVKEARSLKLGGYLKPGCVVVHLPSVATLAQHAPRCGARMRQGKARSWAAEVGLPLLQQHQTAPFSFSLRFCVIFWDWRCPSSPARVIVHVENVAHRHCGRNLKKTPPAIRASCVQLPGHRGGGGGLGQPRRFRGLDEDQQQAHAGSARAG